MTTREWAGALALGVVVRLGAVALVGPQPTGDAPAYLEPARAWMAAGFSPAWLVGGEGGRSPAYAAFLAAALATASGDVVGPILVQAVLSAAVPAVLYAAVRRTGGSRIAAWTAAGLAAGSFELTRWTLYVLADSLLSTVSALTMAVTMASLASARARWGVLVGLGVVSAALLRPTGLGAAAGALLAILAWRPPARGTVAAVLGAIAAYGLALHVAPVSPRYAESQSRGICHHLLSGRVLWGDDHYRAAPIAGLAEPEPGQGTGACVRQALARHPGRVAEIALRKAIVYWMPVYAHYSPRHRLANLALLGAPLLVAGASLWRPPRAIRADVGLLVPLAWLAGFTALHAATWVESDHRFLAPALPALYVLAGRGAERLAGRVVSREIA